MNFGSPTLNTGASTASSSGTTGLNLGNSGFNLGKTTQSPLTFGSSTTAITNASTSAGGGLGSIGAQSNKPPIATFSIGNSQQGALSTGASNQIPSSSLGNTISSSLSTSNTGASSISAATAQYNVNATNTSVTYKVLEDYINKWMAELDTQEKDFLNQATQLNALDKLMIDNGEKASSLNKLSHFVFYHTNNKYKVHIKYSKILTKIQSPFRTSKRICSNVDSLFSHNLFNAFFSLNQTILFFIQKSALYPIS